MVGLHPRKSGFDSRMGCFAVQQTKPPGERLSWRIPVGTHHQLLVLTCWYYSCWYSPQLLVLTTNPRTRFGSSIGHFEFQVFLGSKQSSPVPAQQKRIDATWTDIPSGHKATSCHNLATGNACTEAEAPGRLTNPTAFGGCLWICPGITANGHVHFGNNIKGGKHGGTYI